MLKQAQILPDKKHKNVYLLRIIQGDSVANIFEKTRILAIL
jgi:hypothetical protein